MPISNEDKAEIHDRIVELADDPQALKSYLAQVMRSMPAEERADLEGITRSASQTLAVSGDIEPSESLDSIWDALEAEVIPTIERDDQAKSLIEAASTAAEQGDPEAQSAVNAAEGQLQPLDEQAQVEQQYQEINRKLEVLSNYGIDIPQEQLVIPTADPTKNEFADPYDIAFTDEQKDQILGYMEVFYGQHFSSWEEFVNSGFLDRPTKESKIIVGSVREDQEPTLAFEVNVPGYKTQYIRQRDLATAQSAGFDATAEDVSTYVKLAAMADMVGGDGETVVWQPLMLLAKSTNLLAKLENQKERVARRIEQAENKRGAEDVADIVRDIFDFPDEGEDPGFQSTDEFNDWLDIDGRPPGHHEGMEGMDPGVVDPYGEVDARLSEYNIRELGERFKNGLTRYEDAGLAYIHAVDPGLAERMAFSYENDGVVPQTDQAAAARIIAKAGFNGPEELAAALDGSGWVERGSYRWFGAASDMFGSGDDGGSGSERVITMPDPEAVRQGVKSLYQQVFLEDPTEAELQQFGSQVTDILVANQRSERKIGDDTINQETDIQAQLQGIFEGTDAYRQLYSHKPGGMSETDYSNMFRVGAQQILGPEGVASTDALRSGMMTGDLQTTLGSVIGNEENWDNSTWMGRLARAATAVAGKT